MITETELVKRLEAAVKAAGSQAAFALAHALHRTEVSVAMGCRRHNRLRVSPRVAHALGYRRVVAYEPLERGRGR